ncbi:MAG: [citrate (pro-3S)-lyase] ligase [Clostridiaceae bacterium]
MYTAQKINLAKMRVTEEVDSWLQEHFQIKYGQDVDATFVVRQDEELIATASRAGNVFKYFGISKDHQGENLSGILLGALINEAFDQGIYHYFIFTSPQNSKLFKGAGFTEVIENHYAALLEGGRGSITEYMEELKREIGPPQGTRGAIVMNLNPLTKGHLYLIEQAKEKVDELIIFLVEEDLSLFPFEDRLAMVSEAVKDKAGVKVVPGGPYIISQATFPTYFLKKVDENLPAYTTTDAGIFGKYYAAELGISHRFVGEEPLDMLTSVYNEALAQELKNYDVQLHVIQRKESTGGVISASRVRNHLAKGEMDEAKELVPPSTWNYLESAKGKLVIEKIRARKEN